MFCSLHTLRLVLRASFLCFLLSGARFSRFLCVNRIFQLVSNSRGYFCLSAGLNTENFVVRQFRRCDIRRYSLWGINLLPPVIVTLVRFSLSIKIIQRKKKKRREYTPMSLSKHVSNFQMVTCVFYPKHNPLPLLATLLRREINHLRR